MTRLVFLALAYAYTKDFSISCVICLILRVQDLLFIPDVSLSVEKHGA